MSNRFLLISRSASRIFSAALRSRFLSASTEFKIACSTILPSRSTSSLTCLISVSKVLRNIIASQNCSLTYYNQFPPHPRPLSQPFGFAQGTFWERGERGERGIIQDRKSTRLNSSHHSISYAV